MSQQKSRDVLFMDVHGVFLTAESPSQSGIPLIGPQRHQKWVNAVRQALHEAGALPLQIKEALFEPRALWTLRMRLELTTPKTVKGRVIRERKFHERVNLRLLQEVAPTFMRSLDDKQSKRVAQRVKALRLEASRYGYILEQEMRELIHWLVEEDQRWMIYLTTAADPERAAKLLRTQNAPMNLFTRVFATEKVGLPKSHPRFWTKIAAEAGLSTDNCVVIEDNLAVGVNAVKAGMSVILLDRDYGIEDFIRNELHGEVAGIALSQVGESLPLGGERFVVCAKSPAGIRLCLQRIRSSAAGGT